MQKHLWSCMRRKAQSQHVKSWFIHLQKPHSYAMNSEGKDAHGVLIGAFAAFGGLAFVVVFSGAFGPPYVDFVGRSTEVFNCPLFCCRRVRVGGTAAAADSSGVCWQVFSMIENILVCGIPLAKRSVECAVQVRQWEKKVSAGKTSWVKITKVRLLKLRKHNGRHYPLHIINSKIQKIITVIVRRVITKIISEIAEITIAQCLTLQ